jgi:hypothetical protein
MAKAKAKDEPPVPAKPPTVAEAAETVKRRTSSQLKDRKDRSKRQADPPMEGGADQG